MNDPFDPDEFGEIFAEAMEDLCDDGTEIDCSYTAGDAELSLTMNGVEYRVTITADAPDAASDYDED